MLYLVIITGSIYILVIASFLYGWEKLKSFTPSENSCKTTISVIIPMRNEENSITKLLEALSTQDYPTSLYEIIVIDDHSSDQSVEKALKYEKNNCRVMSLPVNTSGKKAAIRYGIETANNQLIVSTDADCYIGNKWLRSFADYFEKNEPVMMLAPVLTTNSGKHNSIFTQMLSLELMSLLVSTAGASAIGFPIMCNGANLAFVRSVYPEISYLYDNVKVRSGDDIFALLTLKNKYSGRIHFIKSKEASVYASMPPSLNSFIGQRKRWTAKAKFYNDPAIIFTALVVFAINSLLFICLLWWIFKGNFSYFLVLLFMKSAIDFPVLQRVTAFFETKKLMRWFPVVQSFYFLYVCFTVFAAFISPIKWKGRLIQQ
jgi:glycosyltransferase involved in cell wall biosynthesis